MNELIGKTVTHVELGYDGDVIRHLNIHTDEGVFCFYSENPEHSIKVWGELPEQKRILEVVFDPLAQADDEVCAVIGILLDNEETLTFSWLGDHSQYLGLHKEII